MKLFVPTACAAVVILATAGAVQAGSPTREPGQTNTINPSTEQTNTANPSTMGANQSDANRAAKQTGVSPSTPNQSQSVPATMSANQTDANQATNQSEANPSTMGANQTGVNKFKSDLQNEGFTDVKIMPQSFLVRAKDKEGRPVMMVLNPDSFTEVVGSPATKSSNPPKTPQANE